MIRLGRLSALVACGLLVACSSDEPSLPDRADLGVQQEETRIATMLMSDVLEREFGPSPEPGNCAVRLLREDGATDYVWADCERADQGFSTALRIDGEKVTFPEDGSGYASSIRRTFPADLAEAVLADDERYRP